MSCHVMSCLFMSCHVLISPPLQTWLTACPCWTWAAAGAAWLSTWPPSSPTAKVRVYLNMDETKELNINLVIVTALSNSDSQRLYIEEQARNKGLSNLKVITGEVEFQLL